MYTARTPAKKTTMSTPPTPTKDTERAGPSKRSPTITTNVRRSIGQFEGGITMEPIPCTSKTHAHSPVKTAAATPTPAPAAAAIPKTRSKAASPKRAELTRRISGETFTVSPGPGPEPAKPTDRVSQAKIWLQRAKNALMDSRNLKTDLKTKITVAVEMLFKLVKEEATATQTASAPATEKESVSKGMGKGLKEREKTTIQEGLGPEGKELLKLMKEQGEKIEKTQREMEKLRETITLHQETAQKMTYAHALSTQSKRPESAKSALHSIVIASKNETETGEQVMEHVRKAVNARDGWVTVERVRKVKDRKVIIGCRTVEERDKLKQRLSQNAVNHLNFEETKNRDPMVVLRDVLTNLEDKEVMTALRNQNAGVFQGLRKDSDRITVKFRRKARNALLNHVVLSVSPEIYGRMMDKGVVHIDLQRVRVADQSPLVQCSMCLAYGHGKRFCRDTTPKCTHCGGPHMKYDCDDWKTGTAPKCCNCVVAKHEDTEHNAYSTDCPVRRRWEALARAKVQYC